MKIVQIGNIGDTGLTVNVAADRLPRVGIIIEASPDEIAALPFNPAYATVELRRVADGTNTKTNTNPR